MPSRRALSRATASAAAEMSVARHLRLRPLVRERERDRAGSRPEVERSSRLRSAGASVSASSTSVSVSGRGISTSGVTRSTSPQNSRTPVSCATGSPSRRRFASAKNAFADSGGSASVAVRGKPRARHVEDVGEQHLRVDRNEAADHDRAAHRDGVGHGCGFVVANTRSRYP